MVGSSTGRLDQGSHAELPQPVSQQVSCGDLSHQVPKVALQLEAQVPSSSPTMQRPVCLHTAVFEPQVVQSEVQRVSAVHV